MATAAKEIVRTRENIYGYYEGLQRLKITTGLELPATNGNPFNEEYYTGGKKSGMLVQDPTKVHQANAIFNQARQFSAVEIHASVPHSYSNSHANVPHPYSNSHVNVPYPYSNSNSFTRIRRLLSGEAVSFAAQQRIVVTHNIVFWRNGFTVDNSPFRRLDDPQNASFLESIRKSERPKEFEPADRRIAAVYVNLFRMENDFPEPEKHHVPFQSHIPFQGARRTLGRSSSSSPTPMEADASASVNTVPPPTMGVIVDNTSPSTSIQVRLADGTRVVSRFNYHHTIRDIRAFIDAMRPSGDRSYELQAVGFPPKQLTDLEQTIEQAGLAKSVVIQN
ncbi:plant UBX domain-containing protein 4-like [Cornus florida]|uniref:plant UBX domain-containing protein 4-like n=1 Tax=Cornus florida TaxID=4283 RepID=UPI0028985F4B|nr:plant UBX domain-containing protein 4-like [Cornus florida]